MLFKLGRSYLDREKTEQEKVKDNKKKKTDDDVQELDPETEESVEDLGAWTKNKLRGFRRVNPTASSQPKPPAISMPTNQQRTAREPAPPPSGTTPAPSTPGVSPKIVPENPRAENDQDDYYKGKYCHFYVNTGKCNYEERSGYKCKFEHRSAPLCNFCINCSRPKCMFAHHKINGMNPFLGSSRGMSQCMIPWQIRPMMNPWMTTQPRQFMTNP